MEDQLAIEFFSAGTLHLVKRWINDKIRLTIEEISELISEYTPERIRKYLD